MWKLIPGFAAMCAALGVSQAQDTQFSVEGKSVQVHAFVSQGFALSSGNNYLTMDTRAGSFAFSDFGANISAQLTDKLRVGAQIYDRDIGDLGNWRPQLDWAQIDYKLSDGFGIRAGKVKTTLGLYNDTQDLEFLHTWAILPQSMYPLDLRGSSIAHVGGDFYGVIPLSRLGSLSYTAYAGLRPNDANGGYIYGLRVFGISLSTYDGRMEGGDLRWNTPVQGLLVGTSYLNQDIRGSGITNGPPEFRLGSPAFHSEHSKKDETLQSYVQYSRGRLSLDAEYRRNLRYQLLFDPLAPPEVSADSRSMYGAVSYRFSKHLQAGTYYSRYYADWQRGLGAPGNHIFDGVAALRVDLTNHWSFKVEGHFIDGYGALDSIHGFYLQQNPQGFNPKTNLLVLRTGFSF